MEELTLNKLDTWLQNQIANTVDTPYEIKITDDLGDDIENVKSVATILKNNSTKYVVLEITATGLTSLANVFRKCVSLIGINIPNGVTNLTDAFIYCTNLKSIYIPDTVESLEAAFCRCTSLHTVEHISNNARDLKRTFLECSSLRTINDMEYIIGTDGSVEMELCFSGCSNLISVRLPKFSVGLASTFFNCTRLQTVDNIYPNYRTGYKSMRYTFQNCSSLTTINNWRLTDFSDVDMTDCFSGCTALTNIYVPRIIETANTWKVVKLQGSANSVDYAIYDSSTGTKLSYGTIPIGDYGYVDLYEYTDEILFDAKDVITEAKIQEFIQYKVKFGTNGLDPSKKNFVFWADDPDAFVTNMDLGGSTAEEAEKLKTARTINGTSFDGTANITTSKWGTARTIAIKDKNGTRGTTTSVDGSGNVTLTLPTTLLTTSDIWIE